jgi:hypothetical protein
LERRETLVIGAMGGVAHETVKGGPDGTKYLRRRPVGRLLQGHVGFLALLSCLVRVVSERLIVDLSIGDIRWIEKPTAVPKAIGSKIDAAGLSKIADGSVREGM